MPKANLWIINYCILEMKAYNEHAISLPVYLKYVKTENCFSIKKKKEKRKKKQVSDVWSRTLDFLFSLEGERLNYTTSAQHRSSCEYMNEELQ